MNKGIYQVCEAVTASALLLSHLKRDQRLDERDRLACEQMQVQLEVAERTLYGEDIKESK